MERIYAFLPSVLVIVCIAGATFLCQQWINKRFGDNFKNPWWCVKNWWILIFGPVLQFIFWGPAVEELIFRAPLIIAFSAMSSFAWYGIFVSTGLWTLSHFLGRKKTLIGKVPHIISLLLGGILLGYCGIKYQSIWVGFGIHSTWNLIVFLVEYLPPLISMRLVRRSIPDWLFELGRQLRQPNGYPFDPAMLKRHLQDAIEGRFVGIRSDPYAVSVDYGMTVEELVQLGHYDRVGIYVSSHFVVTNREGMEEVVVEIVRLLDSSSVSTNEVLRRLNRAGYRPANLQELLAFGAQCPDVQREFPVVALGSTCTPEPMYDDPGSHAPYLYPERNSGRGLDIVRISNGCHESWRLAAVRK